VPIFLVEKKGEGNGGEKRFRATDLLHQSEEKKKTARERGPTLMEEERYSPTGRGGGGGEGKKRHSWFQEKGSGIKPWGEKGFLWTILG